jgi:hypothetical protein
MVGSQVDKDILDAGLGQLVGLKKQDIEIIVPPKELRKRRMQLCIPWKIVRTNSFICHPRLT